MATIDDASLAEKVPLRTAVEGYFSNLKTLISMTPRSHWMPYVCLFLYPILVLQVKSGGSAMLGLLLFSGIYMLVKEKAKFDVRPILPLYYCFLFFWFVDFVTAGLAEREPVAGMLSSFTPNSLFAVSSVYGYFVEIECWTSGFFCRDNCFTNDIRGGFSKSALFCSLGRACPWRN